VKQLRELLFPLMAVLCAFAVGALVVLFIGDMDHRNPAADKMISKINAGIAHWLTPSKISVVVIDRAPHRLQSSYRRASPTIAPATVCAPDCSSTRAPLS